MDPMYWQLLLITIIPVVVTVVLYFIKEKTKFYDLPYWPRQIIIGIIFGGLAVLGTEFGVPCHGATANVRDAAPLLAGLIFGGPAGIIAGVIGGVERFIAAWWGRGFLTQWACSISTILAGVYAALLRKYMFDNKRPTFGLAFAIAVVMEVFHFTLVFLTNMNDPISITIIIKALAAPMIIANAVAVGLATGILQFATRKVEAKVTDKRRISNQIKWFLLGSIVFCYLLSTGIVYGVETKNAYAEADQTFTLTINDIENDVYDVFTETLNDVKKEINETKNNLHSASEGFEYFKSLASKFEVTSVDLILNDGSFKYSSTSETVDFNMNDGDNEKVIHQSMIAENATVYIRDFEENGHEGIPFKYGYIKCDKDSYIAIGLNQIEFFDLVDRKVHASTTNRHIGINGYAIVYNPSGEIISNNSDKEKEIGITLDEIKSKKENKRIRATIFGEDSFYMYTSVDGYVIAVVLPYEEVLSERDSNFMLNSFTQVLSYGILYIMIYALIQKLVVRKVEVINKELGEIINGNLDVVVDVKTCIEFEKLSDDINHTVNTLKRYIDEAKKRIDDELAFAQAIQLSSIPNVFPAFPDRKEFDLFATMKTAKEVGGDFYDYYIIDKDHLAFTIADVSGKGIPAAMFMMESKVMLKNLAKTLISPEEVVSRANDGLAQNNDANMFVTAWFGVLDLKTGHVKFANAGHNSPLIYRKDGSWEYITQKKNLVLAAMEGMKYTLQEFDLNPGDRIYLYTDGVTEATRSDGALYGEDRLQKYLNKAKKDSLEDVLKGVKKDIDQFIDGADQFDDITMLTIEYRGK